MSQFFKAELKDKFLQYASEQDDYFEMQLLYDEFLRPNYSLEYTIDLVREIIDYNPDLLDIMSGKNAMIFMLSATDITEDFVEEEGGFKDIYIEEEEKWDIFIEQLSNTRKLSTKEKVNLGKTKKPQYKRERNLLYTLITAVVISFVFTIYSITKGTFFTSNEISRVEVEERLEEIRKENLKRQKYLEEELFSLKARLGPSDNSPF